MPLLNYITALIEINLREEKKEIYRSGWFGFFLYDENGKGQENPMNTVEMSGAVATFFFFSIV